MNSHKVRRLALAALILYVGLIAGIHYLHTEETPRESNVCPACNFINAAVSIIPIYILLLILLCLFLAGNIETDRLAPVADPFFGIFISRAPPLG